MSGHESKGISRRRALAASLGAVGIAAVGGSRAAAAGGARKSLKGKRVLVGLGGNPEVERVVVRWPDGSRGEFEVDGVRRYHTLRQRPER